jgi:transketolase
MRKQLVKTVTDILEKDERVVLLLGDIGVHGFKEAFEKFPTRVYNIGILEQASVSLAAGLASAGLIPIFHTIAPFMVERAFEQLKDDFGYQKLGGNFISVGASYDYAALGCTHHCPGDVALMKTIPGMEVIVPGHPQEFDDLFRDRYNNGRPTYFRLSERSNSAPHGSIIRVGKSGIVVAIGPMLDPVLKACEDLDVTVLYRAEVAPFIVPQSQIIIVEPFYQGTMAYELNGQRVLSIGVPREFLRHYGKAEQHDEACGLTAPQIRKRIQEFLGL